VPPSVERSKLGRLFYVAPFSQTFAQVWLFMCKPAQAMLLDYDEYGFRHAGGLEMKRARSSIQSQSFSRPFA